MFQSLDKSINSVIVQLLHKSFLNIFIGISIIEHFTCWANSF
jgi:hypothetical protein